MKAPPDPPLPPALPGRKKNEENTSFVEKDKRGNFHRKDGKSEEKKKNYSILTSSKHEAQI